jgi:diphthamide biosynthesis methyltransferase
MHARNGKDANNGDRPTHCLLDVVPRKRQITGMKSLRLLLGALALSGTVMAQSSQDLLNEAQHAYLTGNTDLAKAKFQSVLQRDPDNLTAKNYLRTILVAEKKENRGELEKQLKALVLDKVEFKDASFSSALEYLKQRASKQSAGKTQVSFVVQLPPEVAESKKVTLNLASIPFPEALRYLCELAGADYRIEKYAVIILPKAAPEAAAAQSTPAKTE